MSNTTFTDNLGPFSGSSVNVISNAGGNVNLTPGTGGDINLTSNTSGNIALNSGDSVTATQGGSITLTSGENTNTGNGGDITLNSGNSSAALAGDINLNGGSTTSASQGGSISLLGGTNSSTGNGGAVNITGGTNSSNGNGGDVVITAGVPNTGTQGTITFSALGTAGTATPTPFNDTTNTNLVGFTATSMIGALNELETDKAETASNLGAGEGVFASKVSSDLQFKSLQAGSNMSLSSDANEITIDTTGEPNTASNLGAGEGVFAQKNVEDLEFKSLVAGSNMSLSSDANEITIDTTGEPNTASNLGAGEGVFAQKNIEDLEFKSLIAGTNLSLSSDANEITIGASQQYVYETITFHNTETLSGTSTQPMITGGITDGNSGLNVASYGWCTPFAATIYKVAMVTNGNEFTGGSVEIQLFNNGDAVTPAYTTTAISSGSFTNPTGGAQPPGNQDSSFWVSPDISVAIVANDLLYASLFTVGTTGGPEGLLLQVYTRRLVNIP